MIGNVSVTPQETDVFFRRIPKDSLPYFSSEVEISEILHKPKPNSEAIKNAKEKLNKLLIRIKTEKVLKNLHKPIPMIRVPQKQVVVLGG